MINKLLFTGVGNFLFFLYLLVYIRQYFWDINTFLAWVFSTIASFLISFFIIKKQQDEAINLPRKIDFQFFFIVATPLVFLYLLRFAFPDSSFDIINYHFINGERALRGFPFIEGDFFYLSYSNPVGDMLTGIFRHILGHRLGTSINFLVLIWTASILNKILHSYIKKNWLRYFLIFFFITFEGIIYQISNYWVDLLSIPLILEVVYLLIFKIDKKNYHFLISALLMGMSVGLKLTNLYFALPAMLYLIMQYFKSNYKNIKLITLAIHFIYILILFIFPLVPFHYYIFNETGNPIYPHFNFLFSSPYYTNPINGGLDSTLGPASAYERIFWPLIMLFKSERLSPTPMFPLVTAISYLISFASIIQAYINRKRKTSDYKLAIISLMFIMFTFIWGALSGDFRYVTVLELLGGIILVIFFSTLLRNSKKLGFVSLCSMIIFLGLIKLSLSFNKILEYEWAGRPSVFSNFQSYKRELRYVFRDRSLYKFLPKESKEIIDQAEVWLPSSSVVSGYMVLLNPKIPYTDLHHLPMRGNNGPERFYKTVESLKGKRFFSLIKVGTLGQTLDWSLSEMIQRGFDLVQMHKISVPFFSFSDEYNYEFSIVEVFPSKFAKETIERIPEENMRQYNSSLVEVRWKGGFSGQEGKGDEAWRWSDKAGEIHFINYAKIPNSINFSFDVMSGEEKFSNLLILGPGFKDSIKINNKLKNYNKTFVLNGGETYIVKLHFEGERLYAPDDSRSLYFRVSQFKLGPSPTQIIESKKK